MKAKAKQLEAHFRPVELTITLDTEEELNSFYALMNHSTIISAVNFYNQAGAIRYELSKNGPVRYGNMHDKLNEALKGR